MTNKTKAIVMANKQLRAENRTLWEENETVRRGMEETEAIYRAMVTQLVLAAGGETVLPNTDVSALMKEYDLEAKRDENGLALRIVKREADDGTEHQD